MNKNRIIIINREDVKSELHPFLFQYWLETLGVDPDAEEVCLVLSPLDHNKKIED